MIDLIELFCSIDDFWKNFEPQWQERLIAEGKNESRREPGLCPSEVMTLVVLFHIVGYRNFKNFYIWYVLKFLSADFPNLPSYNRFVELKSQLVFPLHCYLSTRLGRCSGISFVDSTSLEVCHSKRKHNHKVFKGIAQWGKTSVGYFYGFKLHLVVNDEGELLAYMISAGNTDDRQFLRGLKKVFGKVFGDKGYISSALFNDLMKKGIQLITKIKSNMKNKFMPLIDKILLRKRGIIETIIDQLKNISQIEHSRHRSPINFVVNILAGLVAYTHQPKKPSLNLRENDIKALATC
jgi:hypothetical protein